MSIEEFTYSTEYSILSKFGLFSLLIGILFWIYFALLFIDDAYLNGSFWNALGKILDDNQSEQWITLIVLLLLIPASCHFAGLLLGFIGLFRSPRKFALIGLLLNSILPLSLLLNWIYRLIFGYPEVVFLH